ncbi:MULTISPECIES: hypothetical protein [unclassified Lysinibacillus]|uniref:hypothetical protein n=1 Tax=unclassified Lysinibacillus TaxID=2636778 RepID=UPI0038293F84
MTNNKFIVLTSVLVLLLFSTSVFPSQAAAYYKSNSPMNIEDYEIIKVSKISDESLAIALEIAKSGLEENAYYVDGEYKSYYSTFEEANVSKEAFNIFIESLAVINNSVKSKELVPSKNLIDIKVNEEYLHPPRNTVIKPLWSVSTKWYGKVLSISEAEASKIQKVLAAGGGVAALLSILTGIGGVWAAVLVSLYGLGELCNWNNRGYYVHRAHIGLGFTKPTWCTPK